MKNNEMEFIFEYNCSVDAPNFLELTERLIGIELNNAENFSVAA